MKCKKCGQEPEVQLVCEFCGHRWVVDGLDDVIDSVTSPDPLKKLKGLGKEIWANVNVRKYINELRDEWEKESEG